MGEALKSLDKLDLIRLQVALVAQRQPVGVPKGNENGGQMK